MTTTKSALRFKEIMTSLIPIAKPSKGIEKLTIPFEELEEQKSTQISQVLQEKYETLLSGKVLEASKEQANQTPNKSEQKSKPRSSSSPKNLLNKKSYKSFMRAGSLDLPNSDSNSRSDSKSSEPRSCNLSIPDTDSLEFEDKLRDENLLSNVILLQRLQKIESNTSGYQLRVVFNNLVRLSIGNA